MTKPVLITLTFFEPDSGPYNIYSDGDGYTVPILSAVARGQLLAGFVIYVPQSATTIKLKSLGVCKNEQLITINGSPE